MAELKLSLKNINKVIKVPSYDNQPSKLLISNGESHCIEIKLQNKLILTDLSVVLYDMIYVNHGKCVDIAKNICYYDHGGILVSERVNENLHLRLYDVEFKYYEQIAIIPSFYILCGIYEDKIIMHHSFKKNIITYSIIDQDFVIGPEIKGNIHVVNDDIMVYHCNFTDPVRIIDSATLCTKHINDIYSNKITTNNMGLVLNNPLRGMIQIYSDGNIKEYNHIIGIRYYILYYDDECALIRKYNQEIILKIC
jgi:hypothetical protein